MDAHIRIILCSTSSFKPYQSECAAINRTQEELYLAHTELAQVITSDRNKVWAQDLYHSIVLVEVAKSLAPSNVIGHGKVPYQKPWLKFMMHAVHPHTAQCIN